MSNKKQKLFSITKKDLEIQFFRAGGKGGQKQNKTSSACRIKHLESGAVGVSRNHRSQDMNKKEALRRLASTQKFKLWVKIKASGKAKTLDDIEKEVDRLMSSKNLKIDCGKDALK